MAKSGENFRFWPKFCQKIDENFHLSNKQWLFYIEFLLSQWTFYLEFLKPFFYLFTFVSLFYHFYNINKWSAMDKFGCDWTNYWLVLGFYWLVVQSFLHHFQRCCCSLQFLQRDRLQPEFVRLSDLSSHKAVSTEFYDIHFELFGSLSNKAQVEDL